MEIRETTKWETLDLEIVSDRVTSITARFPLDNGYLYRVASFAIAHDPGDGDENAPPFGAVAIVFVPHDPIRRLLNG